MIQPRGINDHKRLHFIPHYLTLLDSKYIHDLALFLAEKSHFSNSRLFITHTFFSIPLNRIPTLRIILCSLACVCVLPRHSHLLPNRELQNDVLTAETPWVTGHLLQPLCRLGCCLQILSVEPHTCYKLIFKWCVKYTWSFCSLFGFLNPISDLLLH